MHFDTRPATADDFELVYRIKCAAMGPYVEATWGWNEKDQRRLHEVRFKPDATEILLGDGQPVGALHVVRKVDEIVLLSVYVHPNWQAKGIGTAILGSLKEEAVRDGLPIRLHVLKVNERARALYERHGFRKTETLQAHYRMVLSAP